jgi:hypothetical protein
VLVQQRISALLTDALGNLRLATHGDAITAPVPKEAQTWTIDMLFLPQL